MDLYNYLKTNSKYKVDEVVKHISISKDQHIYIPGQSTHAIFEIVRGAVKIGSYGNQGCEITYDVLSYPDTFGNLKYLNGQFFEFAKTLTPTILRSYHLDFYKKIIVEDPIVSEWFNKNTVRRWSIAEARLFRIRSAGSLERMKIIYDDLNRVFLDAENKNHNLFYLLTNQDLGDLTGITRQTVSQTLKKLLGPGLKHSA